jgi:hypothetical protein
MRCGAAMQPALPAGVRVPGIPLVRRSTLAAPKVQAPSAGIASPGHSARRNWSSRRGTTARLGGYWETPIRIANSKAGAQSKPQNPRHYELPNAGGSTIEAEPLPLISVSTSDMFPPPIATARNSTILHCEPLVRLISALSCAVARLSENASSI